jgi:hypothetical protein
MIKKVGIKTKTVSLPEAYSELSPNVFAAFVVLSTIQKKTYKRNKIPKLLGKTRSSCSRFLEQLVALKYIKIKNKGIGKPSVIYFLKRLEVEKDSRFVIS